MQNRLDRALTRLNPSLPAAAVFDAYRKLLRVEGPNLRARNRALHRVLADDVNVEYTRSDGSIAGAQAQVIDFERPEQNDWLAVNQFTVVEGQQDRRADVVIFVNGLPLGVVELKNPAYEGATVWKAVEQLEDYQSFIPALFTYNATLVVSDGVQARIGALGQENTAAREGREELVIKVKAISDHDDGRVFHRRVQDQPVEETLRAANLAPEA